MREAMLLVLAIIPAVIGVFCMVGRVCGGDSNEKEGDAVIATICLFVVALLIGLSCVRAVNSGYTAVRTTMFGGHKVIDEKLVPMGWHVTHPLVYYISYPLEPRSVTWVLRADSGNLDLELPNTQWLKLLGSEVASHPQIVMLQITAKYSIPEAVITQRCKASGPAPRLRDSVLYQSIQSTMKAVALRAQGREVVVTSDDIFWQMTRDQLKRDLDVALASTGAEADEKIEIVVKTETSTTQTYGDNKTKIPETEAINPAGYGG
jgi:hypothetical protein